MTFETRLWLRGYRNQPTNTRIVANGTFLNESHLMPVVGLWIEVCEARPSSQTWPSGTQSLDSSTTNSDAEP